MISLRLATGLLERETPADIKREALGIACVVTAILVSVVLAVALALVHRKAGARARGAFPGPEAASPTRFLAYAASLLFWPIGLVMTFIYMAEPSSARYGRNCFLFFTANILFITYATCAFAFVFGSRHLELLP
jgi:hypothetical protein